jgi:hypothetical protein
MIFELSIAIFITGLLAALFGGAAYAIAQHFLA